MKGKTLKYLSNGSLIIGAALGGYALVEIYILKSKLPEGVCPVTSNRPILYSAITFCCISFILSLFETKNLKSENG